MEENIIIISKALQSAIDKVNGLEATTFDTYVAAYKKLGDLLTPLAGDHSQRALADALGTSQRKVNWALAVDKAVKGRKSFDKIVSTYKAANVEPSFVDFLTSTGIIGGSGGGMKVDKIDVEVKRISKLTKAQRRKLFARLQAEFAAEFAS